MSLVHTGQIDGFTMDIGQGKVSGSASWAERGEGDFGAVKEGLRPERSTEAVIFVIPGSNNCSIYYGWFIGLGFLCRLFLPAVGLR